MSEVLDLDGQVFGAIGDDRAGDGVDRGLVVEVKDNVGRLVVEVIHEVTNERKKDRRKKNGVLPYVQILSFVDPHTIIKYGRYVYQQ